MTGIQIEIRKKAYPDPAGQTEHIAIRNFRIDVLSGEFVCLFGPSGCGKTTLLNIVAGLDQAFEGSIQTEPGDRQPRIAYVFQNPRLLPWRTVRENIELAVPKEGAGELINHLLEAMDVARVQHHYPEKLSLGMSRRVALVRAFATEPDLLLMDEPFVSLDTPTARRIRQLLVSVWLERPHTVLFVTHDLREAIALADRLIFLNAHPMTTAAEVPIGVPHERRHREQWIEEFRGNLLNRNPQIIHLI